jgi:membrane protein required for beta-lactamase induction
MTAAGGEDVLVWNPFSLEEMLGFADYDSFIQCLQTANFANCPRPADPLGVFALQGVELMQVVTRCRGNYQARTWDAGVVLLAVLSLEDWASLQLQSPAALAYRLANTLDAMWGYRNARFERFGWAAAKIDDLLNYLPARLVALTYALLGRTALALRCWRTQAPQWDSPNAGPVMAAGAGALAVSLGGAAQYHGELHQRSTLGAGPAPQARDIERALNLVNGGVLLWLVLLVVWGLFYA